MRNLCLVERQKKQQEEFPRTKGERDDEAIGQEVLGTEQFSYAQNFGIAGCFEIIVVLSGCGFP